MKQSFLAREAQIQANKFWLLEHPEDLGKTKSGETPGSIWQLPELRALVDVSGSTWAVHQCVYGAETSRPTRLASNLPACLDPFFNEVGDYAGPLGCCPHGSHPPLVGFRDECPDGTVSRLVQGVPSWGVFLDVANSPQVLDARRCFHCTEPW